ncbi:Caspase-2 [Lamellibrachia satsuma]|nr:Caspase-2 [Lamellibrachia satsuma]
MDEADKKKLSNNLVRLTEDLEVGLALLTFLQEKQVLTSENKAKIEILPEKGLDRASALLSLLPKRGPKAFRIFIEALVKYGHEHLAELVDKDLTAHLLEKKSMVTQETTPMVVYSQETKELAVRPVDKNEAEKLLKQKDIYDMSKNPRGRAVIISNFDFGDATSNRRGTDSDKKKLEELFMKLFFDTIICDDLKAEQIRQTLKEESRNQKSSANAFVLCILSHGERDHIYGTDWELISIEEITTMFDGKSCPQLINKPKIFIVQACRGDKVTQGVSPDKTDSDVGDLADKIEKMNVCDTQLKVHEKADMISAFSTVLDYASWRNPQDGSWFINDLVDTFVELAWRDDILHLLSEVRRRVSRRITNDESIALTHTGDQLSKNLYFFPGYAKPS